MNVLIVTKNYNTKKANGISRATNLIADAVLYKNMIVSNNKTQGAINYLNIKAIRYFLKSDIVIINGIFPFVYIFYSVLCLLLKKKYIIFNHGHITYYNLMQLKKNIFYNFIGKKIIYNSFCYCYASNNELVENFPNKKKIFFPFVVKKNNINKRNRIVYLGRISKEKNVNLLVNVFESIDTNLELEIYGTIGDAFTDKVKPYYKGLLGEGKFPRIAEAKFLILPSLTESFGLVIGEALSVGTPVIVTNRSGWEIESAKCGYQINPTYDDLLSAMKKMIEKSDDEILEMGKNGQNLIEEKYNIFEFNKLMSDIIEGK